MVMIMMIKAMKYLIIVFLMLCVMNTFCFKKDKYKYEAGKKYYFKDADLKFNSKPLNEAEYKYFEDQGYGYYIGIFDERDDLLVFERWELLSKENVRIEKYLSKEIIKGLIDNLYPALYYSIIKEKGIERPDKQIDIKIAKELLEYYKLTFDKEKLWIRQQKITKKKDFVETNSYYEKGKKSMHIFYNSDNYCFKYRWDEEGKLIEEVIIDNKGRILNEEEVRRYWSGEE